MCPSDLEEREVDRFRNLTWLYISCIFTGGGSAVRHEEVDWGQGMPGQDPYLLSFRGAHSIPGIVSFNRSILQQDDRISVETE